MTRGSDLTVAAIKVGAHGLYHSEHGDWPAVVTDYEAGRDQGDYRVGGFVNAAGAEAGTGPTFDRWTVVGDEQGAFTPHG